MGLSRTDLQTIAKMIDRRQQPSIFFATVAGVDIGRQLVKVNLEPYGTETTWCKAVKGFFPCEYKADCPIGQLEKCKWSKEIVEGIEVLVAAINTLSGVQYVVLGELE